MKKIGVFLIAFVIAFTNLSCDYSTQANRTGKFENLIVRIAEVEVDSSYIDSYKFILNEEAEASMRLEPEVICIYPMIQKENPTQIRILEIYASKHAYDKHLKSPHFLKYKTATQQMVKSLRLVEMEALDSTIMSFVFYKFRN